MTEPIPVLTLWQPWASLIALGVKRIETRPWATNYRGPLAIHAAARPIRERSPIGDFEVWPPDAPDRPHPNHPDGRPARIYCNTGHWLSIASWWPLPLGGIVATCDLVDVVPIEGMNEQGYLDFVCPDIGGGLTLYRFGRGGDHPPTVDEDVTDQRPFGDFTPGRFAWLLDNIRPLDEPVPFKGGQRLTRRWAPVR